MFLRLDECVYWQGLVSQIKICNIDEKGQRFCPYFRIDRQSGCIAPGWFYSGNTGALRYLSLR